MAAILRPSHVLDPLALAELGVEAPVDEHAVAEFFKALDARCGLGDGHCTESFLVNRFFW